MEMRGRNRKWLRAGNGGTIQIVGVNVAFQFSTRVSQVGRGVDAFIIIDVVEHCAQVGHHECVWSENRGRNRRGSVDGEKGADCRELMVDFFFLDVEETSDVVDHLLVGES